MENRGEKWFHRTLILFVIWLFIGILTGWKQYYLSNVHSHINNFVIFRSSFSHFIHHVPLYVEYPKEHFDLFLYGPIFPLLMAPFTWISVGMSVVLWNTLNAIMLFWAIYNLPIPNLQRSNLLWIIINSAITALLNTQFHGLCIAMIIWSYIYVQRGRDFWATFLIVLGILIKFYGVVGIAFFFFSKTRLRFLLYFLMWVIILGVAPFIMGGFTYGMQCYQEWIRILTHKNELNVNIANDRTDVCVMGMVRRITGNGSLSNYWFLVPSMLINLLVYFQPRKWFDLEFQLRIVAFVTIYLMLASTGTESPTLIMAFPGVGLWFLLGPKARFHWFILAFTLLISSFSPTDLFPSYLRTEWINPYGLMIFPLLVVWIILAWELWFVAPKNTKPLL